MYAFAAYRTFYCDGQRLRCCDAGVCCSSEATGTHKTGPSAVRHTSNQADATLVHCAVGTELGVPMRKRFSAAVSSSL